MSVLNQTNEEIDFELVGGGEDGAGIPWDIWLENLQAIGAESSEWGRAEEFAASVLAVAESKRRSSENERRFYDALASLAPHTELVCYLEIAELADWDTRDFHPHHLPEAARMVESIRAELESWRQRASTGNSTAREDAAATRRVDEHFRRARTMRFWRERQESDEESAVRCPRCGSADVRCSPPQSLRDRFMAAVFEADPVRCRACRHRFRMQLE